LSADGSGPVPRLQQDLGAYARACPDRAELQFHCDTTNCAQELNLREFPCAEQGAGDSADSQGPGVDEEDEGDAGVDEDDEAAMLTPPTEAAPGDIVVPDMHNNVPGAGGVIRLLGSRV